MGILEGIKKGLFFTSAFRFSIHNSIIVGRLKKRQVVDFVDDVIELRFVSTLSPNRIFLDE